MWLTSTAGWVRLLAPVGLSPKRSIMAFERKPSPEMHPPCLWQEPQENYYTLLYQFFDYTTLSYCRGHLTELTLGAFADEYQPLPQPGNLLYFYDRLLTLLYALNGILKEDSNQQTEAEAEPNVADALSLPQCLDGLPWHALPHHLTFAEINQPFIVIRSFFQFQNLDAWTLELHDWLEAALSNSTIIEWMPPDRLLPVCTHLYKIVEAAFVLHHQSEGKPHKEREKEPPVKESGAVETESGKTDTPAHQPEKATAILRKPSPMYFFFVEKFKPLQDELVKRITETNTVRKIFLLGSTFGESRTETLFSGSAPTAREVTHCFLLVLVKKEEREKFNQLQDRIETACAPVIATTAIVLQLEQFNDWLWDRHPFAHTVQRLGVQLYKHPSLAKEPTLLSLDAEALKKEQESTYAKGINKVQEFLAGAELYTVRKQYKLAAFMLHQAAEHSLLTLLKVTTGLRVNTHNLDRLIRYGSMVSYRLPHLFPQNKDTAKRLFRLLQHAY